MVAHVQEMAVVHGRNKRWLCMRKDENITVFMVNNNRM